MKQEKELLKNTIIIALGKFSTQIVSFLLMSLYTAKLTTEQFGNYDLIITIITFLAPVITLTLEESMFRFLIDAKDKKDEKTIISQTLIIVFTALVVSCVLIFGVIKIFSIHTSKLFIPYVIAVVIMTMMNALVRGLGKIKLYSLSNFVLSVLTIILNIVFVLGTTLAVDGLLLAVILSNILVSILLAIIVDLPSFIDFKCMDKITMKRMLAYSIPLIPNSLSWIIITLSDRVIVTWFLGAACNGIYAISNKFPTIINTVYNYFSIAWKESAAKALQEENSTQYYNRIYKSLRNIVYAATVGVIAVVPFAFKFLVHGGYNDAYMYIPILVFAVYFSNMSNFYGGIFSAYMESKIIGRTTVISAIINLAINILLIKFIGIYAAALSTLVSSVFLYMYRKIKMGKYVKLKQSKTLLVSAIITIIVFVTYYSKNYILQALALLLTCVYAYMLNHNVVKLFLGRFKRK